jgi:DMSO/TMAO reductase YedYZ heme-binding membrane subunit
VAEHLNKIYGIAIVGVIIVVAFLTLTSIGHVVDLAVQHFMLFYAGVFALIALCASVGAGLICTDRMFLHPGQRVMMQSIHRAVSFGALLFLIIHIVTEILAQRIHVIDAFVPFLVPFKTFYIGLGTIASDLIILIVVTGVLRRRFTASGKNVWRWRAIHYTSYVAFVFGVWHGLLGGRAGKPYVDWSYGFVVAFVALGLAVRILSNSLRPKETLSSAPVAESASSGSAPMRAAAMYAQFGAARATQPATMAVSGGPAGMLPGVVQGHAERLAAPVYEAGYDGPPRYTGAQRNPGSMPRVPGGQSGPRQRPMTGPMPQPRGTGATGPLPWEKGFPETDPNLKYRAPGPGMPGYRAPGDRNRGSDEPR